MGIFVAGRYSQSYNAVDVGITDEGIRLRQGSSWENIEISDAYGDSLIDGIYRGGNCTLMYDSKEFKAGAITPFWPWGALGVLHTSGVGGAPVGRRASDVAAATVLTATTGSPTAVAGALAIATLTSPKSILAPNSPAEFLFNTRLRKVPIMLALLPTEVTQAGASLTTWYTVA